MIQKPKEVIFISYDSKFADCWTFVLSYPQHDYEETIATSGNPNHPQGVFSHIADYAIYDTENKEAEWDDLSEGLQRWVEKYIKEANTQLEQWVEKYIEKHLKHRREK